MNIPTGGGFAPRTTEATVAEIRALAHGTIDLLAGDLTTEESADIREEVVAFYLTNPIAGEAAASVWSRWLAALPEERIAAYQARQRAYEQQQRLEAEAAAREEPLFDPDENQDADADT